MKKILLLISLIMISSYIFSQTAPDTLWTRTYSANEDLNGKSIIKTSDNGYLILCDTFDNQGNGDIYLIKTDYFGVEEWRQVYGNGNAERAVKLVKTGDECYLILGTSKPINNYTDAILIKVDDSGNQLWLNTYGSDRPVWVSDLAKTDDGGYIFCGNCYQDVWFGWIVKTDASGIEQWSQTYYSTGVNRWFNSIIQTENGGFLAAGEMLIDFSYTNLWLISTDFEGNVTASAQSNNEDVWEQVNDIKQLADNNFLLTGRTRSINGGWEGFYMNVEPDLSSYNWANNYPGEVESGFTKSIIETDNFDFLGFTISSLHNLSQDVLLVNTDSFGNVIWETSWGNNDDETGCDILLDDNNIIILADKYSYEYSERNIWLLCVSSNVSVDEDILESNFHVTNHPNPFNPSTTIEFSIQNDSEVELAIFNIKGQKIKTLANNEFSKGSYSIVWDGRNESYNAVSSGIYYYKLIVNGETEVVNKCLLLK